MSKTAFTREQLTWLLERLNSELQRRGASGTLIMAGGAAIMYAFHSRRATADIDALFHPPQIIRECVATIAREEGIQGDWLNDGVKGFFNGATMRSIPLLQLSNLRVERLDDESLLAMKLFSARDNEKDALDAKTLIQHLGLTTAQQALDIVEAKIPRHLITPDTQYFTEDLFATLPADTDGEHTPSIPSQSPAT
ncbi:MAG: hypothetical protein IJR28_05400 [Ottowia sp.]|nr:hypothetical protein [Ottowia sp.]